MTTHRVERHTGGGPVQHEESHHVVPLGIYFAVFIALMVLLVATVGAAKLDLGPMNTAVALVIAVIKAGLIMTFFMHLRWSSRLTWAFALSAFLFLMVLFLFTMSDYFSRPWMPIPGT